LARLDCGAAGQHDRAEHVAHGFTDRTRRIPARLTWLVPGSIRTTSGEPQTLHFRSLMLTAIPSRNRH
jgi:hypothetical protein